MPTEAQVLAQAMDRTRQYTMLYFSKLEKEDLHRRFVCEGVELNTAYWLMAHLATTENGLLLASTGGPFQKFSWAKHFTLGSKGLPEAECPPIDDVLHMIHDVHTKAMEHVANLDTAALDAPNPTGIPTLGKTVRDVITHAIRHEGAHVGQLAWLCKLYGIRTM